MNTSRLDSDCSTSLRLARVERQLALHRVAATVVLLVLLAALFTSMMAQDKQKEVIRCERLEATKILCGRVSAKEFLVRDDNGQVRCVLQVRKNVALMCLLDPKQRARLLMKCLPDGTSEIQMLDSNDKIRYYTGYSEATGSCSSRIQDREGKLRVNMGLWDNDNRALMGVFDGAAGFCAAMEADRKEKGAQVGVGNKEEAGNHAGLYTKQHGARGLIVVGSGPKESASVLCDASGRSIICIKDEKLVSRISMALSDEGAGLEVQDKKGNSRGAIGEKNGRTVFHVLDKEGAALVKTEKH